MPKLVDFEGIGLVEVPDDWGAQQIENLWKTEFAPKLDQQRRIKLGQEAAAQPEINPDKEGLKAAARAPRDLALSFSKGVVAVPEAAVGLADIATGGYAGKALESLDAINPLREKFTIAPKFRETKEYLDTLMSPEQQDATARVREAKGFVPTLQASLENPSTIAQTIAESVPSMLGGAAAARKGLEAAAKLGPKAAAWAAGASAPVIAGAAGEGLVSAGSAAENIRQQTPDKLLTWQQAGLALGTGALTGAIGAASGRLAKRLGLEDPNTWLVRPGASAAAQAVAKTNLAKVIAGALTEGALEELPQSAQEQVASNLALGKPWDEGVAEAAATGLLAGAVMGGGAQFLSGSGQTQPQQPPPPTSAPPAATAPRPAPPAPQAVAAQVHPLVGLTVMTPAGAGIVQSVMGNNVRLRDASNPNLTLNSTLDALTPVGAPQPPAPAPQPAPAPSAQRTTPPTESEQLLERISAARASGDVELARRLSAELDYLGVPRPEAAMEARQTAPLGIQREPVVTPEIAAAARASIGRRPRVPIIQRSEPGTLEAIRRTPQPTPVYAAQDVVEQGSLSVQPPRADVVGEAQPAASTGNRIPNPAGGAAQGAVAAQAQAQEKPQQVAVPPQLKSYGQRYVEEHGVQGAIARVSRLRKRMEEENARKNWTMAENLADESDNIGRAILKADPSYDWTTNEVTPPRDEPPDSGSQPVSPEPTPPPPDAPLSLGPITRATPTPSLSIVQVKQAVRELFLTGSNPPNFDVVHNYGLTRKTQEVLGLLNGTTGKLTLAAAPTFDVNSAGPVFLLNGAQKVGDYDPATRSIKFLSTIPPGSQPVFIEQTRAVEGFYSRASGKIILNAAYISTPEQARQVFVEEAVHAAESDPQVKELKERLKESITKDQMRQQRTAYGASLPDSEIREEVLAKLIKAEQLNEEQKGILRQLWDALILAIERLFGEFGIPVADDRLKANILARTLEAAKRERVGGGEGIVYALGAPANLSQAAVDIATTKVADMGQTALADWKAAAQRLDELGSQTPSSKAAHASIKQQMDDAQAAIMRMPSPDWTLLPKPAEGVAITGNAITVSPAFSDKLKALGIAHDPTTVAREQAELFFEQKAVQLTSMRRVLTNREELLRYYESLPQASQDRLAGEIATLRKSIERQRRSIADLDKVDHAGTTLGTRSDEIESAQDGEIENRAKGAALSLQQVIETFGEPGEQRAGVLADIQSIIADPANTSEEVKTLRSLLGPGNLAEQFATLSEQQRDTVIASLATLLRQFDLNHASLQAVRNTSLTSLAKQADTFRRESGDVASERAKAEAMLEQSLRDALASASTLQTQAEIQELLNRLSAIVSFAQTVGSKPEANKALYQWFATGPVGTPPAAGVSTASVGTDPLTLKMILDMAGKSPDFASAVGALIENKVKDASVADFKAISDAAKAGDSALAASLIGQLQQQANAAVTTIKGQQRAAARTLAAMAVQVRAMDNGITLFSQVAGSPSFGQLRSHVEANAGGFVIREIVDNATRTTFKEFGKLGVTPYSKEVSILPSVGEFPNRDDWQNRIQQWMTTAQQYVTAYSIAKLDFDTNPANPSPESLGYDAPTARGLQQAINSDMPIMLDWANYDPLKRLKSPWMLRMMQDHHVIGKIMRNPQRVWDMIGGLFGAKVRQAGSDLSHSELLANRIHHRFKGSDALIGAAMRSHAADGIDNNIEAYRTKVWEELHHEARQFTGKVKVGFILPRSGLTVTKADMDALRSDVDFGNAVRRELEETRTDRGVVQNVGGVDYVRKGASPGDLPTPRTLSSMARGWANSLIAATEETPQADRAFTATTDLSATSPNKIVQFWNANPDALASHVLDSARTDRTMTLDPLMAAAEQALSRDIRSRTESLPSSLEDLVQKLAFRLPPSGFMARDFVVRELGKELSQYHREAKEIADTDTSQQKNSGINVLISALNEYTKPAAKLRLPSNLYTYGSLTPGDRMFALKRGTHEKAVQLVVTISQAIADIGAALEYWNGLPTAERTDAREKVVFKQFGSLVEAEQSKRIVEAYLNDAIKKYELVREGADSGIEKVLKGGFRLTLGMLLAGATVAINNTVSASLPVFMAHSAASQLGAIGGFLAVSKYLVRLGVTSSLLATRALVSGGEFALDNTVRRWLGSGPGKKFLSGAIEGLTKKFLGLDPWIDLATVQRLGFSQRDGFWDRLERYYNELSEYDDNIAQDKARKSPKTTRAFRALRALGKTELQYYIQTGIELQDLAINVTNLASVKAMENDLKAFAMKYGAERERQGLTSFDFSDPRWQANAHEGFRHPSATVRERQLARLREKFQQFAGSSGAQLEQLLWNYHQAQKTNPDAPFFTPEQWDNFARQTLADTNATTKANRPSYSQAHPDTAMLTMFWGYSTWLANTMVHELAQVRGTKTGAALTAQLATVLTMLMAATAIGLLALTGKEEWNRRFRNKYSRNPVLTDAEFWGSPRAAATAAGIGAAAMIPVLGSLAMNIQDVRAGGKGYDPGNIFVPISLLGSLATAVRGFAAVPWQHSWIPAEDLLSKIAPRYQKTMKLIGRNRASRNASAIIVGAAPEAGIDVPKRGSGGGNIYGQTTGIRRGIDEAVQKMSVAQLNGDQRAYDEALADATEQRDRIVAYYRDEKGMTQEKAESAARRDYNELNPVRKAFQGRAITDEEYRRLDAALGTSERGQQARAAVAAWQAGSQALFGVPGSVTKEETAANRPSGGGTRSYGGSSRSSGGGYRRISLTRGSRGSGLVRSPSLRRSRVSTRRFRSGLRSPRLRKVRVKRVRLTA